MGPGRTHGRARMAPGAGLRSRWLGLVPGVREAARVGTQGGENDAPQKGRVPGEESPRVLGNPEAGVPPPPPHALELPQRGARPLGGGGCRAPREGVTAPRPAQAAGGGSPGATTLRSWDWHPVPSAVTAVDGPQDGGREGSFLAKVEVGGGGRGHWCQLGPSRARGGGPGPWFFPSRLPSCLPTSLPCSFIQCRSGSAGHIVGAQ